MPVGVPGGRTKLTGFLPTLVTPHACLAYHALAMFRACPDPPQLMLCKVSVTGDTPPMATRSAVTVPIENR
jgi:hypothetical protein